MLSGWLHDAPCMAQMSASWFLSSTLVSSRLQIAYSPAFSHNSHIIHQIYHNTSRLKFMGPTCPMIFLNCLCAKATTPPMARNVSVMSFILDSLQLCQLSNLNTCSHFSYKMKLKMLQKTRNKHTISHYSRYFLMFATMLSI